MAVGDRCSRHGPERPGTGASDARIRAHEHALGREAEWARRSPAPIRRAASGRPPRWSISQPIWPSSETASSSSISIPRATPRAASASTAARSTDPSTTPSSTIARSRSSTSRRPSTACGSSRPSIALAGAEVELAGDRRPRAAPRPRDRAEADAWDWILIDCPPSLGLLTVNALTGADAVLIPIQCEYYALEGLTQLIATINLVRDHLHPDLAIAGVLLTMFDAARTSRARSPPRSAATSATRSSRRSSRAASACRRRRATACRSRSTGRSRRAPRRTRGSPTSSARRAWPRERDRAHAATLAGSRA